MSDISIVFPWWFTLGAALVIALPVTTAIMVARLVRATNIADFLKAASRRKTAVRGRRRNPVRFALSSAVGGSQDSSYLRLRGVLSDRELLYSVC